METTTNITYHSNQESKGTQCIKRVSKVTSTCYEESEEEEEEEEISLKYSKTIMMFFTPPKHTRGKGYLWLQRSREGNP